jgi:hypothetical protein
MSGFEVLLPAIQAAIVEGNAWLQSVLERRRDERTKAAARMLHQAGVIVLILRDLNNRLQDLLNPITVFDPEEWSQEQRESWTRKYSDFLHQSGSFDELQTRVPALEGLKRTGAASKRTQSLHLLACPRCCTHRRISVH